MTDTDTNAAFAVQSDVRGPWRRYLDAFAPLRPALHRYCRRLTGNVWDAEDLMQDTLLKLFGLLGKIDADLAHPRAYFIRTATHLWIDEQRRLARHRSWATDAAQTSEHIDRADMKNPARGAEARAELHDAAGALLGRLAPRERAAIVMREVLDLSAKETAAMLQTTEGAVKAALHRGRERLEAQELDAERTPPSPALVEQFLAALASNDLPTLEAICAADLSVELVGGAQMTSFEQSRTFFQHAHTVFPPEYEALARKMVLGSSPHWRAVDYRGERIVLGFRTWEGIDGLNEIHRIEEIDGKIGRIRCYCFCPDTLAAVATELGVPAQPKPYRSP